MLTISKFMIYAELKINPTGRQFSLEIKILQVRWWQICKIQIPFVIYFHKCVKDSLYD